MTRGHQIMVPRMTRGHTTREVGASVLCHYRKDAAKGSLVKEDGEPGNATTQDEPSLTTAPAAAVAEATSGPGGGLWWRTMFMRTLAKPRDLPHRF